MINLVFLKKFFSHIEKLIIFNVILMKKFFTTIIENHPSTRYLKCINFYHLSAT